MIFPCPNDSPGKMKPNITFTIEPAVVEGDTQCILWKDGWTISTKDFGWAAQFEHTVLITDTGVEILTK